MFAARTGDPLSAGNVRREFRRVIDRAGPVGAGWTPRGMWDSFMSVLSDSGVPLEHMSRLVGHNGTTVTEKAYRRQIRPVMEEEATVMDRIFPEAGWIPGGQADHLVRQLVRHPPGSTPAQRKRPVPLVWDRPLTW